jgi:hypothetical protein
MSRAILCTSDNSLDIAKLLVMQFYYFVPYFSYHESKYLAPCSAKPSGRTGVIICNVVNSETASLKCHNSHSSLCVSANITTQTACYPCAIENYEHNAPFLVFLRICIASVCAEIISALPDRQSEVVCYLRNSSLKENIVCFFGSLLWLQ